MTYDASHTALTREEWAVAVDLCAFSVEHSGGHGEHDAKRYGPCRQHESDGPHVARLIWEAKAAAVSQAQDETHRWGRIVAEEALHAMAKDFRDIGMIEAAELCDEKADSGEAAP